MADNETPEAKLLRIKQQNSVRAKRYYDAHKEVISQRRKDKRVEVKEVMQQALPKLTVVEQKKEAIKLDSLSNVIKVLKDMKSGATNINNTKQIYDILDITDLSTAFNKPKTVIKKIEEATLKNDSSTLYAVNSKKGYYQTILCLIDQLHLSTPPEAKQIIKAQHDLLKMESNLQTEEKKRTEVVMDFDEYLELVEEKYYAESKEYIIASLYKLSGFRDNLQLKIISKETAETKKNDDINYIIVPSDHGVFDKRKNLTVLLNVFKTDKKYKKDTIACTKALSVIIRKYMGENGLEEGDYLLGNRLLSGFISKFNKDMGLEVTINKLRQMRVSYIFNNNEMDAKARVALAKEMKHAPATSVAYLRKVAPKK